MGQNISSRAIGPDTDDMNTTKFTYTVKPLV